MLMINNKLVEVTRFPDGTSQVWKIDTELLTAPIISITWEFDSESELMHLCQLKMLIDEGNIDSRVRLYMPYLPYARQDKDISNDKTFALHTFARIINGLRFDRVSTMDVHSNIAHDLFENFINIDPGAIFSVKDLIDPDHIIAYADQNAYNKYSGHPFHYSCVYGKKKRNQLTGNIDSYEVVLSPGGGQKDFDIKDRIVLIQDDICDGGGTFILLAKKLYEMGAKEVYLYTTHGIYSKGLKPIFQSGIKRIFNRKGELFDYKGLVTYEEFARL